MMVQVSLSAIVCGWKLSSNWMSGSAVALSAALLAVLAEESLVLSSEDAASDVAALLAAVLVVLELLQAARERTSKAESANDTTFFMIFSFISLYEGIIHQKRFGVFLFQRVFQNEAFIAKNANEAWKSQQFQS
jgi:hypothetical protein